MSYFIGPFIAFAFFAIVLALLLKKRLRERHAIWWLIGAFVAFVLSLVPEFFTGLSSALGIEVPLNLVFVLTFALIFFVNLQQSAELTRLEEKVRTLAEHVAELEMCEKS